MSYTPVKRQVYLLPNYFKKIGIAVIIGAVAVFIIQTQSENFLAFDENYGIPGTILLTGLALINFAKEKVEDERIRRIRYRTWAYSFYLIITYILIGRILNHFGTPLHFFESPTSILVMVLVINIGIFAGNKEFDVDEE